jgi:type I restriction enzyme M protein
MFYNTGISTYIWILSNHKTKERQKKIQLINAVQFYQKMRKNLGSKRKELGEEDIEKIGKLYFDYRVAKESKIFDTKDFGYTTITIERPLMDESGIVVLSTKGKTKGQPQADPNLRDTENVPLKEDIAEYFKREVLPHAPDAWIDVSKSKVGYDIPFTRHFYEYKAPRLLGEIDSDLKKVISDVQALLNEVAE